MTAWRWIVALAFVLGASAPAAAQTAEPTSTSTSTPAPTSEPAPTAAPTSEPAATAPASALSAPDAAPADAATEPDASAPVRDRVHQAEGVADARLANLEDGVGERFAAWVSERFFTGAIPSVDPQYTTSTDGLHDRDATMLLTEVGLRFSLTSEIRARADWGFAFSSSHVAATFIQAAPNPGLAYDARTQRVEARNPVLAIEWTPVIDNMRLSIGLGTAAPTAAGENLPTNAPDAVQWDASRMTHRLMVQTAGGLAPWRYRPERFALFLPVSFYFPVDALTIGIEGAASLSGLVIGAERLDGAQFAGDFSAAVHIAGDVTPEVRLGARFAVALLDVHPITIVTITPPSSMPAGIGAVAQPSATAYVRLRFDPVFVVASFLANFGGRAGVGGRCTIETDTCPVWALTVGAGATVD
jgi:hypothetical protein